MRPLCERTHANYKWNQLHCIGFANWLMYWLREIVVMTETLCQAKSGSKEKHDLAKWPKRGDSSSFKWWIVAFSISNSSYINASKEILQRVKTVQSKSLNHELTLFHPAMPDYLTTRWSSSLIVNQLKYIIEDEITAGAIWEKLKHLCIAHWSLFFVDLCVTRKCHQMFHTKIKYSVPLMANSQEFKARLRRYIIPAKPLLP